MANIALIANSKDENLIQEANALENWLLQDGHNVYRKVLPAMPFVRGRHILDGKKDKVQQVESLGIEVEKIDLAVSLGGDGAILHTVEAFSDAEIPVLGVNYGQMGYLAEVDPKDAKKAVENFLKSNSLGDNTIKNNYEIEERMRLSTHYLEASYSDSKKAQEATHIEATHIEATHIGNALNEVFLGKIQSGHTIRLTMYIAEKQFMTYEADGIIIATPTGSTAYSLSAGGPIVEPDLETVVITPVAPHMIFDRSLVIAPDSELRLEVLGDYSAEFSIDGYSYGEIKPGESIAITRAKEPAKLISYNPRDFHKVLKSKFGLKDR